MTTNTLVNIAMTPVAPPEDRERGRRSVADGGDKIRSEQTYVDRQTVAELLGLKAK
jgi:hypothetical protein